MSCFIFRSGSFEGEAGAMALSRSDSSMTGLGNVPRDSMTPWEELQLVLNLIK